MRLSVRIFLSFVAAALIWLVAPSAHAAAPQCDARGAITFAPNPTLDEPNTSIDIGQADDCSGATVEEKAYDHGRSRNVQSSGEEAARVWLTAALVILPATPTDALERAASTFVVPMASRDRIERPPR